MNNNELYHYGVLGMKWGVRRYQNPDGSLTEAGKKRYADKEVKKARKQDSKYRRTLSDDELKEKVDRLKMEKQLKDLTKEDVSPGKKYVENLLSSSGSKIAGAVLVGVGTYAAKSIVGNPNIVKNGVKLKDINWREMASYIPKPKNK